MLSAGPSKPVARRGRVPKPKSRFRSDGASEYGWFPRFLDIPNGSFPCLKSSQVF
jgi:hypothetical protein